jgi:hypothetical protein
MAHAVSGFPSPRLIRMRIGADSDQWLMPQAQLYARNIRCVFAANEGSAKVLCILACDSEKCVCGTHRRNSIRLSKTTRAQASRSENINQCSRHERICFMLHLIGKLKSERRGQSSPPVFFPSSFADGFLLSVFRIGVLLHLREQPLFA